MPDTRTDAIYTAAFLGGQAARCLSWMRDADYTKEINRDLFPYWAARAVELAVAAAHAARTLRADG
jgi:hypothetical protein